MLDFNQMLDVEVGPDGKKRGIFRDRALYDADGNLKTKKFFGEAYGAWKKSATAHPPEDDPEVDVDEDDEDGEEDGDEPEEDE
jgi:hypothetical protein